MVVIFPHKLEKSIKNLAEMYLRKKTRNFLISFGEIKIILKRFKRIEKTNFNILCS